jgi:hypothetical protein
MGKKRRRKAFLGGGAVTVNEGASHGGRRVRREEGGEGRRREPGGMGRSQGKHVEEKEIAGQASCVSLGWRDWFCLGLSGHNMLSSERAQTTGRPRLTGTLNRTAKTILPTWLIQDGENGGMVVWFI